MIDNYPKIGTEPKDPTPLYATVIGWTVAAGII